MIRFINTGLDERIVKSLNPAKTEKMILVHDKQKGNYYRRQLVNVEQPKTTDLNKPLKEILPELLNNLKQSGATITTNKVNEDINSNHWLMFDVLYNMWGRIKQTVDHASYDSYIKCETDEDADSELGGEDYEGLESPGDKHFNEFAKTLKSDEYAAIGGYTYSRLTYRLNNWLRKLSGPLVKLPDNDKDEDLVKTLAQHLDNIISRYTIRQPMVVYRSMRMDALKNILSGGNGTFKDDGYESTTVVPKSFSLDKEPIFTMIMKVPKGKGVGVWLKPVSQVAEENEFLLARGTVCKVHSLHMTYDKNNDPINAVLEVEILGSDPEKLEQPERDFSYSEWCEECSNTWDD